MQVLISLPQGLCHALLVDGLLCEVFSLMLAPLPWMPVMSRAGAILLSDYIKAVLLIAQNEH
ncbi:MAG: hypothetical protein BWY75_03796 [bacterium ADurb.Bin425]|nr:MAG: hypothetical protein BWY75_03796 [bacterium ADurb.Bin425]